ncbi:hypothetical protein [Micromonospora sp. NPDC049679]|uniref:hypothetical protein n=1 Tax=Micromonospora sp. NPDC049679 TaxID=3155920 RepID=UPI0033C87E2E
MERPTAGSTEHGHPGERLVALALRIALIAGAAAAACLALALFDRPAYAGERPAMPGLVDGVIDVVAAVPRSLAGPGPSAGDRTGPAGGRLSARPAEGTPPRTPGAAAPHPVTGAAPMPIRRAATAGAPRGGEVRRTSDPGKAAARIPGAPGPARGPGAHGAPARTTTPERSGLGAVVSGLTGTVGRTVEGTTNGLVEALPLPAAVTGPILVDVPGAVIDVVDAVVDLGLDTTEVLIPPSVTAPLPPHRVDPVSPTPTQPVTGTPSPVGGSTPVAPIRTRPSPAPLQADGGGRGAPPRPASCALACVGRADPAAHRAVRASALDAATADDLPVPRPPVSAPFGQGLGGVVNGAGHAGVGHFPALAAAVSWRTDSVLLFTSPPADAVRGGRSPAVPALPG